MRFVVAVAGAVLLLSACDAKPGTVSQGTAGEPSKAAETPAKNPTWGEKYTWPDGLAVEVAAPQACKPSQYASPASIKRAVKVKVTVTNGTDKPYDTGALSFGMDAQFGGAKADAISDYEGPCDSKGLTGGTVLPGKTYTFENSYAVAAEQGELQLTFEPTFGKAKAIYVGKA